MTGPYLIPAQPVAKLHQRTCTGRIVRLGNYSIHRFWNFFLLFKAIFILEAVTVVSIVLSTRPRVTSPFFYVPISVLALTLATYLTIAVFRITALFRSNSRDRRNRRHGVALDIPPVGWTPDRSWKPGTALKSQFK